jgi:osmotically-inducible protein OsmY
MAIITIYQGASGSGEELARQLAESLGYRSVDREVLVEASVRYAMEDYQPTPASAQVFEDFALATRVRAILAFASDMPRSRLDIKATQGRIAVSGTVSSWASEEFVVGKIKQISGVKAVDADIVSLPIMSEGEWP